MMRLALNPSDKQRAFLTAKGRHIAYGGARGGGKSWAVRAKAALLALRWPGIKILIVRRTFPELERNHIGPLREMLKGLAVYNTQRKQFRFANGSTISCGYCGADNDVLQYQGAEFDVIFLEEATQLKEEWIKKIVACNRGVNSFPRRVYYTCNPGGVSHQYIKRLFVDRKFLPDEVPEDYTFIQALVQDNPALMESDPEYVRQLKILPPKLRAAWLDGRWDIFDGQFFEELRDDPEHYKDRRWTHVIDAFTPPHGWTIYRSFDWGYSRPFSCAWWAVDYDGVLYRMLELYGCERDQPNVGVKWVPERVFAEIHRVETTHPWLAGKDIIGVADPAIWDAETGESIADTAGRHQVYFTPGDHQRIPGWMQCHYRLAFDEDGYPMMYVFANCEAFRRTVPMLEYDEHRVEDIDTTGEDHVADEWRYMCMSRPIKPRAAATHEVKMIDPLAGRVK